MRGEHRARQAAQAALGRQRLGGKGVCTVKGKLAAFQRIGYGFLVHQCAPGGVQQNGTGLHFCKGFPAHQPAGLRGSRTVQAEHITAGKQGVKVHELHPIGGVRRAHRAGAHQHLHAKGLCNAGGLAADAAVAVDAKGLAQQLHLRQQTVLCRNAQLPVPGLYRPVVPLGALADGQQQTEGHLRHAVSRIARHVGHCHPMAAAGFKVDIIRAGGDDAHPFKVRALRQYCFVNAALVDEHQLCIPDAGCNIGVVGARIAGGVRYQCLYPGPVQVSFFHHIAFKDHCLHNFSFPL